MAPFQGPCLAGRGPIESAIPATGSLNAVLTVEVGSQVNFNTRVKKGRPVTRIDPEVFQARVNPSLPR